MAEVVVLICSEVLPTWRFLQSTQKTSKRGCATCMTPAVLFTSALQYTYITIIKCNANLYSQLLVFYEMAHDMIHRHTHRQWSHDQLLFLTPCWNSQEWYGGKGVCMLKGKRGECIRWCNGCEGRGQCNARGHRSPADSRHFWHSSVSCCHCAAGENPFIQPRKAEGKEKNRGKYMSEGKERGYQKHLTSCKSKRCKMFRNAWAHSVLPEG